MDLSDRIKSVIKESGLRREDFANRIGTSRAQLFNYLSDKNEPPYSFFRKIKEEFPWVDLNWLIADSSQLERSGGQILNGNGSVMAGGKISMGDGARIGGIHGADQGGADDPEVAEVCDLVKQYASKSFLAKIKEKLLMIKGMSDI